MTGSSDYAVFGAPRNQTGTTSRFGSTGEPTDATTGDVYLRSRHYDPNTGRFRSADTVQPSAPGTQGYNRYAYVANNPMRYTDPTGHTISDVTQGIETLTALIGALVLVGETTLLFLPFLLIGGPIALVVAMVLFILIQTIVALIFHVLNEILDLIRDEFDHFESDRPCRPLCQTPTPVGKLSRACSAEVIAFRSDSVR